MSSTGGPSVPQLATLLEQSAAGVQSSRSPMKISVGIPGRAAATRHGGLNAAAARNCKLLDGSNSSNAFGSATERVTQAPAEKPTTPTRCGSTKVWLPKKTRAP